MFPTSAEKSSEYQKPGQCWDVSQRKKKKNSINLLLLSDHNFLCCYYIEKCMRRKSYPEFSSLQLKVPVNLGQATHETVSA